MALPPKATWVAKARTIAFWLLAMMVVVSIGLLLGAKPAHADAFTVNSTGDSGDLFPGNGTCYTGNIIGRLQPECTLRAAIEEANSNDETDTIGFLSGLSGTITLSGGQLTLANDTPSTDDLTIQGPGARTIAVSGNDASRVFEIDTSAHATISRLTISGGRAELGGGIYNDGTLTLTGSTVSGNKAMVGPNSIFGGGGIYNSGTLTLSNSTVSGNVATFYGGGITNRDTLEMSNSTVSGNTTDADSGGGGGGIYNWGVTLKLTNSTLSGNTAAGDSLGGGGVLNEDTTLTLSNTIIARNTANTDPDASGTVNSQGNNLIGNTTGATGFVASDLKNVNPLLGPLQDNGGLTDTRALLPGSPAVDAGKNTACPFVDQRGVLRKDGDKNGTVICDIGAFERNDLTPPKVTTTAPSAGMTGVRRNTNLSATFSEKMDRTTLTSSTFKLYKVNRDGTLTQVTNVRVGSTTDGLKAILNPFGTSTAVLAANASYRAVVTTGAKDWAGNRLDQNTTATGSQAMVWTFTTGST